MIEKAIPLTIKPGVFKNGTKYQAKNRWYDANGVRWYERNIMGPIGGWAPVQNQPVAPTLPTPLQVTGRPRTAHGWRANDGVSVLAIGTHNKLWRYRDHIVEDITPAGFSPGAFPDGGFVSGGYGIGGYGLGAYGTGSGAATLVPPATWQLDNFGELLVACHSVDGKIYQASPSSGIATLVDATAPTSNTGIVVTPEHFLVALGANQDGRLVLWADQQSLTKWSDPGDQTTLAGAFELPSKGKIVTGRRTRRQTIIWTDVDVYAMTFTGGVAVYGFESIGDNCGLVGPQACVVLGDRIFWMSFGKFFEYDGALKPIDCDVLDYVFGQLDSAQAAKVCAIPMTQFNEIWWTYPSKATANPVADGHENDKYVAYNYMEGHWMLGTLPRSCGIDRGIYQFPIMLDNNGFLFEHENGVARTGMVPFAETGPMEIGNGEKLMRVQQIIPDENTLGDVNMTLFAGNYPTGVEIKKGPFAAANPTSVRVTTRAVRFRIDEVRQTSWRVGVPRLGVLPSGGR